MKKAGAGSQPPQTWTWYPKQLIFLKRWGADAIRDCDGTEFPPALTKVGAKDLLDLLHHPQGQRLGKANPDEVQQVLYHDRVSHRHGRNAFHPPDGG